jgi:hypothetical protein
VSLGSGKLVRRQPGEGLKGAEICPLLLRSEDVASEALHGVIVIVADGGLPQAHGLSPFIVQHLEGATGANAVSVGSAGVGCEAVRSVGTVTLGDSCERMVKSSTLCYSSENTSRVSLLARGSFPGDFLHIGPRKSTSMTSFFCTWRLCQGLTRTWTWRTSGRESYGSALSSWAA